MGVRRSGGYFFYTKKDSPADYWMRTILSEVDTIVPNGRVFSRPLVSCIFSEAGYRITLPSTSARFPSKNHRCVVFGVKAGRFQ